MATLTQKHWWNKNIKKALEVAALQSPDASGGRSPEKVQPLKQLQMLHPEFPTHKRYLSRTEPREQQYFPISETNTRHYLTEGLHHHTFSSESLEC